MCNKLRCDDWVITRFLRTGVHKKDFMGTPAGTHIHLETIMMYRIQGGKIVEQHAQAGRIS